MRGYIFAIIATLFYSPIGVFTKLVGDNVHPMSLNFYRLFFAFIFVLIIIPRIDKSTFHIKTSDIKEYALVGFLLAAAMLVHTLAFIYGTVSNAIILMYTYPVFVMLFGLLIIKEKITWQKIVVFLLAFTGIIVMNTFQLDSKMIGNLIALSAAIFSGIITVMYRKEGIKHSIGGVFWFFLFAVIFSLPVPFIFGFGDFARVSVFLVALGFFTAGYHALVNLGLQKIEAYLNSVIDLILTPLISILLAIFIINEQLTTRLAVAGILIISAGLILIRTQAES